MRLFRTGLGRRAERDDGLAGDHGRPVGLLGPRDRFGNRLRVVPVDPLAEPACGLEALHLIDRVGQRQRPVDGDAVVVEQHDQLVQLQVAGERDGLMADAFHQVAVGGEHVGEMVDQIAAEGGGQVPFRHRHADRGGDALPERAGRGLDARGDEVFGMPRRDRAQLAEALDLVDRHRLVAGQIQQRVEQHRAVAGGEHEAVAVGPLRVGGVEFQELGEQHRRHVGRAHRQAGVAGLRLLHRVHRQGADRIGHRGVIDARLHGHLFLWIVGRLAARRNRAFLGLHHGRGLSLGSEDFQDRAVLPPNSAVHIGAKIVASAIRGLGGALICMRDKTT